MIRILLGTAAAFAVIAAAAIFYVTQPVPGARPGTVAVPPVEPGRLEGHVRMLSETLVPRDHAHPENLDRVAAYVSSQLSAAGGRVRDQPFDVQGKTYRNVVALFGPESYERIVIGAHYDAAGPLPGADDNASGVAGLIELARLLGKAALPGRVELVAYTLEEPPYYRTKQMGSAVHAASLRREGVRVRAMLSLEMIGYFSDDEGSQRYPVPGLSLFYPSRGDFVVITGHLNAAIITRTIKRAMTEATTLPVYSMNAPADLPGAVELSDHLNYWLEGYPAVMVSDTAYYRNSHYHLKTDTADRLDYRRMAQVVQGVYAAAIALAGSE